MNGKNGKVKVTVLPYTDALNAVKVDGKLLMTPATVIAEGNKVKMLSLDNPNFEYIVYPSKQGFKKQTITVDSVSPKFTIDKSIPWHMEVCFTEDTKAQNQVNEYFLSVPYTGSVAMAFMDGAMILDHFWQGQPWKIALNRYADKMTKGEPMGFYFRPLRKEAKFLPDIPADRIPDFSEGSVLEISDPVILPEYITTITL